MDTPVFAGIKVLVDGIVHKVQRLETAVARLETQNCALKNRVIFLEQEIEELEFDLFEEREGH